MQTTIILSGHIQAQGDKIADLPDGRVIISTGQRRLGSGDPGHASR